MPKAVKYSTMAIEIRKDYLIQHLDEVKTLIRNWILQLTAPKPLAPQEAIWGWQEVYRPALEDDPDSNHMLRHHLRSRALWRHHAVWEKKLNDVWHLIQQVRDQASHKYPAQLSNQEEFRNNYLGVALWAAFESVYNRKPLKIRYKAPNNQPGVACGNYMIDSSMATTQERSAIEEKHQTLIKNLTLLEDMEKLTNLWGEAHSLEEKMLALANQVLKSSDILYPCRFCRHLWK